VFNSPRLRKPATRARVCVRCILGLGFRGRLVTMAVRNREPRDREISYYMALGRSCHAVPGFASRVAEAPGRRHINPQIRNGTYLIWSRLGDDPSRSKVAVPPDMECRSQGRKGQVAVETGVARPTG
jgi:hypothetical protein